MIRETQVGEKTCFLAGREDSENLLIQIVGEREKAELERQLSFMDELAPGREYALAAVCIDNWNRELAPWPADPVFGAEGFGNGAPETLSFILEHLVTPGRKCCLGGYSLGGLFALWACCQTDRLAGAAAVSPSVWYPGWMAFAKTHACRCPAVYLSLGDREERSRNPLLQTVGSCILQQERVLEGQTDCVLEWNPGNHFREPELRMAKGFAWLLNRGERKNSRL